MLKNTLIITILFLLVSTNLFSVINGDITPFSITNSTEQSLTIQFNLDDYKLKNIDQAGELYQEVECNSSGSLYEKGMPDLPTFSTIIQIPNYGSVVAELSNIEYIIKPNIIIYPFQDLDSNSGLELDEFSIDAEFYSSGIKYPQQIINVGIPAIMRDYRVITVTVNPFQFNPETKELIINKTIEIVLDFNDVSGRNIKSSLRPVSRSFSNSYDSIFLNSDTIIERSNGVQTPSYLFIYPDNEEVASVLEDLITWKKQKGFITHSASTSETGNSLSSIKQYIQTAYDTWDNPPEFICLVGDASGNFSIPTAYVDGGEGDHFYTLLEGDDILSDAFIGRLSFNSIFELQTIVSKILNYEKDPFMGNGEWFNKALLVGDPTVSGQSCVDTNVQIKGLMHNYSNEFDFDEVYNSPWISPMTNSFNSGVSYFNYRGFYGMSGWENYHINSLNNGRMLPVAVLLTCSVGGFASGESRTEAFLKAGTPGNPKGAIAAIGTATSDTNTCFNNCVDSGIYYGIFADRIYHLGGALNRGKLNLYASYPNNPVNAVERFSYWNNLMGDPGMEIWTGTPQQLNVDYDVEISSSTNYLQVSVLGNDELPLHQAWVTLTGTATDNNAIHVTGYTDESGNITLPIELLGVEELTVTVSKHNFIPFQGTATVYNNDTYVNIQDYVVDDDSLGTSSGNGDSIINSGESIELLMTLNNNGTVDLNSVYATLSCENGFVTIEQDSVNFGLITAGENSTSQSAFMFRVDSLALDNEEFDFIITIYNESEEINSDVLRLENHWSKLEFVSFQVLDDNGILDAGETTDLALSLINAGDVLAEGISGIISCSNENIIINADSVFFGDIAPGVSMSNLDNFFNITASEEIASGSEITFNLQISNGNNYTSDLDFQLQIGETSVTDSFGPDEYGYISYDDGDDEYPSCPLYNWLEIDPDLGGLGNEIPLYDSGEMGDIENIDLPFILKFYGEYYTTATVCSNGWLSPGVTESRSFMNWPVPGPGGPSPLISPFWDDLKMGDGKVHYYHDETEHKFIIQWSNLENAFNNAEETFQVVIYDSNFYHTETGDNQILFQYKTINNVDQGNYGDYSNHGEYATVGLEDHSGSIGSQYTYSNIYPSEAKPLQNEMAILFSTSPVVYDNAYVFIDYVTASDSLGNSNFVINSGDIVNLDINLKNIGSLPAENVSAVLTTHDEYATLIDTVGYYGLINPNETDSCNTNFVIEVDSLCIDRHNIIFSLNIFADNDLHWESSFGLEVHNPVISSNETILDFGELFIDSPETNSILIQNIGSDTLRVHDVICENEFVTIDTELFNLAPNETQEIQVTMSTNSPVNIEDTILILSNDLLTPILEIGILGEGMGVLPPEISVSQEFISVIMESETDSNSELVISNIGFYDLNVEITSDDQLDAGKALSLNGDGSYVNLGNDDSMKPDFPFTVSAWIKVNGQSMEIFANDASSHDYNGFWILVNSSRRISLTTGNGEYQDSSNRRSCTSSQVLTMNEWYHISMVGHSFSEREIYINGEQVSCTWSGGASTLGYSNGDARIGRYYNFNYLDGNVDDLRFWDYARSEAQIQNTMHSGITGEEEGLIGYWNFDGPNPLMDISGNGNDGMESGLIEITESEAPITGWFEVNPKIISIEPQTNEIINIALNSYVLTSGSHESNLKLFSNDPDSPELTIPVSMTIDNSDSEEYPESVGNLLKRNYPNPFNPTTTIEFNLKTASKIKLHIYNVKGQKVKSFSGDNYPAGLNTVTWNGTDDNRKAVSSGIYFYQLNIGEQVVDTKKCLLLK